MAYTLSLSNGTSLLGTTGLQDGSVDSTSTSLSLVGKNYPSYGRLLNENFIHLLENFAKSSAPDNALPGQIWYDSDNKALKVNVSTAVGTTASWKMLASIANASSSSAITNTPKLGDFWWDTTNKQLRVFSNDLTQGDNGWILIGPLNSASSGTTGAVPDTITDTAEESHVAIKFYVNGEIAAILSQDDDYVPLVTISNTDGTVFSNIRKGLNLPVDPYGIGPQYHGNANIALNLWVNGSSVPAASFVRSDVTTTVSGPLRTSSNEGVIINSAFVANVDSSGNGGIYLNNTNKKIGIWVKTGTSPSVVSEVAKFTGAAGGTPYMEVNQNPTTSLGVATKQYVDTQVSSGVSGAGGTYLKIDGTNNITGNIVPNGNVTLNFGSSTARFNTIFAGTFNGTAVKAQYADLAERFEADAEYDAGTVVELGGDAEITMVRDELSDEVFGVVSTRAAYLMNAGSGDDVTHPAIAVSGRVPVKVIGQVRKGSRLVSAGNGIARAATKQEITPWNVIGRALENKNSDGLGVVEAIVKVNS